MPQVARLIGDLTASKEAPKQYRAGYTINGDTGTGSTGPFDPDSELIKTNDDILRKMGLDPNSWIIDGNIHQWSKQMPDGTMRVSIFAGFHRKTEATSKAAHELAKLIPRVKPKKPDTTRSREMVVCLSDFQTGKDGPDATGPEDLTARYRSALAKITAIAKHEKPRRIIIIDVGDSVENITSSAPNQSSHNWLEFPDQLRLWQRTLTQTIISLYPYAPTIDVGAVPSNHAEVRDSRGKVGYGDYGIGVAHTVEESLTDLSDYKVTFHYPPTKYDTMTPIPVDSGLLVACHGHMARSLLKFPDYVAEQAASVRNPFHDSTIVVHGHWHTPGYTWSRGRDIISCPMFDPGSAWFEQRTGEYSNPSIATFFVDKGHVADLRFVEP